MKLTFNVDEITQAKALLKYFEDIQLTIYPFAIKKDILKNIEYMTNFNCINEELIVLHKIDGVYLIGTTSTYKAIERTTFNNCINLFR